MGNVRLNLLTLYKRILVGIISSIAGIAGLLYSFGFIAEEARKSMIGMTAITAPPQEYLYTGAMFFISLPFFLKSLIFSYHFFLIMVIVGMGLTIYYLSVTIDTPFSLISILSNGNKTLFLIFQVLVCGICIVSLMSSSAVLEISGLLLPEATFPLAIGISGKIFDAVFSQTAAQKNFLTSLYGWIIIAVVFFGYDIWRISTQKVRNAYKPHVIRHVLLNFMTGLLILCLIAHIILLPVNYGRIIKGEMEYPVIRITFKEKPPEPFTLNILKMWLLYDTENEIGVYVVYHDQQKNRAGKLIVCKREEIQTIELLDKSSPFSEKG